MPSMKRRRESKHSTFEESLSSKPFLFVIGEERREFHVHKDLISRLSPVLDTLVNGKMREASENRVEWPDTTPDTFVRFAKYAYSGDYQEAKYEMLDLGDTPADAAASDASGARQPSTIQGVPTPSAGSRHQPPQAALTHVHHNGIEGGVENGNGNGNGSESSESDFDSSDDDTETSGDSSGSSGSDLSSDTDTSDDSGTETETDPVENPENAPFYEGLHEAPEDFGIYGYMPDDTPSAMDEDEEDSEDDETANLIEEELDDDNDSESDDDEDEDTVDMSQFKALPFDLESYVWEDTRRRNEIRRDHIKRYHSSALSSSQTPRYYEPLRSRENDPWVTGRDYHQHPPARKRRRRNYNDDAIINDNIVAAQGCHYNGPPDPRGDAIRRFSKFRDRLEAKYIQDKYDEGHFTTKDHNTPKPPPSTNTTTTTTNHHHCPVHSYPTASFYMDPDNVIPGNNLTWEPRLNVDRSECYEPVFLSHANLYILADKYGVDDLRHLTLKRLHDTLYKFDIYPDRVQDIVSLTDVLFENTADADDARLMMVDFWACISEHVTSMGVFKELIRNNGDFASMLFERITPRLT